jgi:hypothetical protein
MITDMHDKLFQLVGKYFRYQGCKWLLIEVMPENDSLVLRRVDSHKNAQSNQFGAVTRYGQQTLTIAISNSKDTDSYSTELTDLLSGLVKTS